MKCAGKEGDTLTFPVFYLDSSAIAKRYCQEAGTDFVNALYNFEISQEKRLYTAKHAISEIGSTLYRKMREGRLTEEDTYSLVSLFLRETKISVNLIETGNSVYMGSLNCMKNHPLRAGDAVHLATALKIYSQIGSDLCFVCNDYVLCEAAVSEGLEVLIPNDPTANEHLTRILM